MISSGFLFFAVAWRYHCAELSSSLEMVVDLGEFGFRTELSETF